MSRTFGRIRQIGHVVYNLDEALDRWGKLGIGPFYRYDHVPLDYFRVGGKEMKIDLSIALGYSGGMHGAIGFEHCPRLGAVGAVTPSGAKIAGPERHCRHSQAGET